MSIIGEATRNFLKPILAYLDDGEISEIMINGPKAIYFEKKGKLYKSDTQFESDDQLMAAVRNIAQYVGKTISEKAPILDARLPDGSRIHVVVPPCARDGAYMNIRKFFREKLSIKNLVDFGAMNVGMAKFLKLCILLKKNMLVSGGTSSGKTTMLNVLSSLIPNDERIVVIEDSTELQLQQEHLVAMETKGTEKDETAAVTMRDLLKASLRMRPDRIIIGEVRGGEALDLLQAMNTGHSGSMATVHSNNPRQTLHRLETLCLQSEVELPHRAIKSQIASAIDIIVHVERLRDGTRRVTHITEIVDLDPTGDYVLHDLFLYQIVKIDPQKNIVGQHVATHTLPTFYEEAQRQGYRIEKSIFGFQEEPPLNPA